MIAIKNRFLAMAIGMAGGKKQLAQAIGASEKTVYNWMTDPRKMPLGKAGVIANMFNLNIELFKYIKTIKSA